MLGLVLALSASWAGAVDGGYPDELVDAAHERDLAASRAWHALLHYRSDWFDGVESEVDAPRFFLAERGKTDPQAELEATLRAFFEPPVDDADERQHPQCRFPARYAWLNEQLGFDPQRLAERDCPAIDDWLETLDPESVTLVYAAAYLNGPSSTFGHTFLRIDQGLDRSGTPLNAYVISFAAQADDRNAMLYALKGLAGFYKGAYSIDPYYDKVHYYNDLESRDLWEYRLALSDAELHRLMLHIWELDEIWYDYYFFDENCAYHLLGLFEATRPELDLKSDFEYWAIPTSTVRRVREVPGLVDDVHYRPSHATQLEHRYRELGPGERRTARRLADGELEPDAEAVVRLERRRRAAVLEVAYDILYHAHLEGEPRERTAPRLHALLAARSRLDAGQSFRPVPVPGVAPDEGHATTKAGLAAGVEDGRGFAELRLRPAYHDLVDPDAGYTDGAQIELFDLTLRAREGESRLAVQSLDLVDIVSLTPRTDLLRPFSWAARLGWQRRLPGGGGDGDRDLLPDVTVGGGLTYRPLARTRVYALAQAQTAVDRALDEGYSLSAGVRLGLLVDPVPGWRVSAELDTLDAIGGADPERRRASLAQRVTVSRNLAVDLTVRRTEEFGLEYDETILGVNWYF